MLLFTGEENSEVLPRPDTYKTGALGARQPSWLTDELAAKIRGNKIRIHSAVWVCAFKAYVAMISSQTKSRRMSTVLNGRR